MQDKSKVLVMDADGTFSKGVARSLRKLGTKASMTRKANSFGISRSYKNDIQLISILFFCVFFTQQKPYIVKGGFRAWVKNGLRIKMAKPETAFTILNEVSLSPAFSLKQKMCRNEDFTF